MEQTARIAGAVLGITGIVLGAFGAHAFEDILGDKLDSYQTGTRYQMYHALLLLFLSILYPKRPALLLRITVWASLIGVVLFSGSIYLLTLMKVKAFAYFTPFGGLSLIIAWACLIVFFFRFKPKP